MTSTRAAPRPLAAHPDGLVPGADPLKYLRSLSPTPSRFGRSTVIGRSTAVSAFDASRAGADLRAHGTSNAAALEANTAQSSRLLHEWRELRNALESGVLPDASQRLRERLEALGFSTVQGQAGREDELTLRREGLTVRIEPVEAAGTQGVKIEPVGEKESKRLAKQLGVTYLAGVTMPKSYWKKFETRREQVLRRFEKASKLDTRIPGSLSELKTFLDLGRSAEAQECRSDQKEAIQAEQKKLTAAITDLKQRGQAPRAVLIYTEGPDAAGKTSTGDLLRPAFEMTGYRFVEHHFKAPSPEERKEHWLDRFRRALPSDGEALRWDRGPAGSAGYVEQTPHALFELAEDFEGLEQELKDENVVVLPYYLHRELDRQAGTFGSREARAQIARRWLESNLEMDARTRTGLEEVVHGFGVQDLRSSMAFRRIHARFLEFVDATQEVFPWMVIDSTHRHEAQIKALKGARRAVEAFAREKTQREDALSSASSQDLDD